MKVVAVVVAGECVFPAVKCKPALADTVGATADKRAKYPLPFSYSAMLSNPSTISTGLPALSGTLERNNPAVSEHSDFNSAELEGCKAPPLYC